jgi:hypothetical protein
MDRRRTSRPSRGAGGFLRDYTAGLSRKDLKRLFERDAAEAYAVLTRDQGGSGEPAGDAKRFFHRLRLLFLGISFKLTPARRAVFAVGLVCSLIGLGRCRFLVDDPRFSFDVDVSPLWATVGAGCFLFLLALELVERVRVRDELEVARQLQRELLPAAAPELPGLEFSHSYRTANEVGGDYYDFIALADGRLAVAVGDASGHGMGAGLLMAIAHATLHTAVELDPRPEAVARLMGRALVRTGGRRAFMTLFYALYDPPSGHLDWVCAGHPFPLLRRSGGDLIELGGGSLPLGLRPDSPTIAGAERFAVGDLLVLYTDGLAEGVDTAGNAFGFDRLADLVRPGGHAREVHDRLTRAFGRHVGEGPLHDDLSLVVVERTG